MKFGKYKTLFKFRAEEQEAELTKKILVGEARTLLELIDALWNEVNCYIRTVEIDRQNQTVEVWDSHNCTTVIDVNAKVVTVETKKDD